MPPAMELANKVRNFFLVYCSFLCRRIAQTHYLQPYPFDPAPRKSPIIIMIDKSCENDIQITYSAGISAVPIAFLSQNPIAPTFPASLDDAWDHSCTINKSIAFEILDGPNNFSTSPAEYKEPRAY
jgi:hypothetical protein